MCLDEYSFAVRASTSVKTESPVLKEECGRNRTVVRVLVVDGCR
jgi:hypothetical protein